MIDSIESTGEILIKVILLVERLGTMTEGKREGGKGRKWRKSGEDKEDTR